MLWKGKQDLESLCKEGSNFISNLCCVMPVFSKISNISMQSVSFLFYPVMYFCYRNWGPAAGCSKANKEARLVERKVCFVLDAGKGRGGVVGCGVGRLSEGWLSRTANRWTWASVDRGRGHVWKRHSQLWQPSWNWSCSGLTSVVVIILSTVNLQFQGWLVPISLRPVLGFWQLMSRPQSGRHVVKDHLLGLSVPIRQLPGRGSEYYL